MNPSRLTYLKDLLDDSKPDEFILYAIAQEYVKMGDDESARRHFLQLKSLNKAYTGLYYHLAALYERIGEHDLALSTYDEGIEITSGLGDLHALSELKNAKLNLELEL